MLHTPRRPGPVPGWSLRATMVLEQEDGRCLARGAEPRGARGAWGAWGARGAGRLASSVRAIPFTAVSVAPSRRPSRSSWAGWPLPRSAVAARVPSAAPRVASERQGSGPGYYGSSALLPGNFLTGSDRLASALVLGVNPLGPLFSVCWSFCRSRWDEGAVRPGQA